MTNDYLTGLAKRTLGLLPVAQPLITPSFASVPLKMNRRPEITFDEYDKPEYEEVAVQSPPHERQQIFSKTESISHQTASSNNDDVLMKPDNVLTRRDPVLIKTIPSPGKNTKSQQNPDNNLIETKTVSEPELSEERRPETEIKIQGTVKKEYISNEAPQKMDIPYKKHILDLSDQASYSSYLKRHEKESANNIGKTVLEEKPQAKHDTVWINTVSVPGKNTKAQQNPYNNLIDTKTVSEPELQEQKRSETEINIQGEKLISPVIKRYEAQKNFTGQGNLTKIDFASRKEQSSLPTVKVTIGRVEIKAVMPQTVQRSVPARKNPALSLDEYLKQHNG